MNIGNLIDLSDVIGSLIGAFLGFAGAYWIFHIERATHQEQEAAVLRSYFDYALGLVTESMPAWQTLIDHSNELAELYRTEWFRPHRHPVIINLPELTLRQVDRFRLRDAAVQVLGKEEGESAHRTIVGLIDGFARYEELISNATLGIKEDINEHMRAYQKRFQDTQLLMAEYLETPANRAFPNSHWDAIRTIHDRMIASVIRGHEAEIPEVLRDVIAPLLGIGPLSVFDVQVVGGIQSMATRTQTAIHDVQHSAEELSTRIRELTTDLSAHLENGRRQRDRILLLLPD